MPWLLCLNLFTVIGDHLFYVLAVLHDGINLITWQAMEMMKMTTRSPFSLNTGYQNYFDAFIERKSNYPLQEDLNVQERALNQVLPYLLFLISPIFMVIIIALQKRT